MMTIQLQDKSQDVQLDLTASVAIQVQDKSQVCNKSQDAQLDLTATVAFQAQDQDQEQLLDKINSISFQTKPMLSSKSAECFQQDPSLLLEATRNSTKPSSQSALKS